MCKYRILMTGALSMLMLTPAAAAEKATFEPEVSVGQSNYSWKDGNTEYEGAATTYAFGGRLYIDRNTAISVRFENSNGDATDDYDSLSRTRQKYMLEVIEQPSRHSVVTYFGGYVGLGFYTTDFTLERAGTDLESTDSSFLLALGVRPFNGFGFMVQYPISTFKTLDLSVQYSKALESGLSISGGIEHSLLTGEAGGDETEPATYTHYLLSASYLF